MSASIDTDQTPRPTKKRHFAVEPPASLLQFSSSASSVAAASDTDDLESHHSGRVSPEKQMVYLEEEVEHPVFYRDFGCDDEIMDLDVEQLRRQVQALADGVGTLGWRVGTLEYTPGRLQADAEEMDALITAESTSLGAADRARFCYSWVNDLEKRSKTGTMVPVPKIQRLVRNATSYESKRVHENIWNSKIHEVALEAALETSVHSSALEITSVFKSLKPLPKAEAKSWNNTMSNNVRATPIAVNIETKAPNKSWTDGKPQLAIWTMSLFKRLSKLWKPGSSPPDAPQLPPTAVLKIPAMPLIVAQGHDWHLMIISQRSEKSIIWQKIDIGNTRNCFDAYKLMAVLHLVLDWAQTVWRPWFHRLIEAG
ncbi:MAG: hypothetical protein L6R38_009449 [Xanthoria sp. 2 TBL-2021]|nr:MAG: hypothetical protein L6R38_009449 [Xanthoria sp. 2 TBL-2021]